MTTGCPDGQVTAGFLPFEGFDAFAARARNGFGAFPASAGTSSDVRIQHPALNTFQTAADEEVVTGAQKAGEAKEGKNKRDKDRKAKRKRDKRAQRNRR